jgi:uncharacterized phiE125 gp8 family phage protein
MLVEVESGGLAVSLAELKAWLRIAGGAEDEMLTRLLRGAAGIGEQFLGQWLMARDARETLPADGAASGVWTRLMARPVRGIATVEAVAADGSVSALPADGYGVDIDADGDGWVRVTPSSLGAGVKLVRVTYRAGMAEAMEDLPDAIRQGIIRLAAEQHGGRGGDVVSPPAVVSALWRPWRRMRLA